MTYRRLAKYLAVAVPLTALALIPYLVPPRRKHLRYTHELASPDDRFVEVDGFKMRYRVKGERGTPIILIHGFASSIVTWYRNMDVLAREHRVYAIDLKGWGLSDKPSEGDYSLLAQAHHLRAFMDALGIERALLVGHSMGGTIAVHMAAEYRERVCGIVLVDPAGARGFPYLGLVSRLMDLPPLRRWAWFATHYVLSNEGLLTRNMPRAYFDPGQLSDEMKQALLQPFRTHGFIDAMMNLTRDARFTRLNGRASLVQCPALVIWGEADRVLPASDAPYFSSNLRDCKLVVLPEAGHLPHEEKADEVNRLIEQFAQKADC